MLNPGPGPNTSLSQIPLPDSSSNLGAVTSTPSTDFKPPPFGLTPPMLFPGIAFAVYFTVVTNIRSDVHLQCF